MLLKTLLRTKRDKRNWLDMTNNKQVSTACHVEDYSVLCNED